MQQAWPSRKVSTVRLFLSALYDTLFLVGCSLSERGNVLGDLQSVYLDLVFCVCICVTEIRLNLLVLLLFRYTYVDILACELERERYGNSSLGILCAEDI